MAESGPSPALAALLGLAELQGRLATIFPPSLADRGLLIGTMAARVIFVFLYGDFVEASGRYLRPSLIYRFTDEQARRDSLEQRNHWIAHSLHAGFRAEGKPWYADNSRESIRDDLIRDRLVNMGIVGKRSDIAVPTTSSKPIYFLQRAFAQLFDPGLSPERFQQSAEAWRQRCLNAATLQRMRLRAQGALRIDADVLIDLPDGARLRVAAGPSAQIAKALVERFAPAALQKPAVLWLSASDRKAYPQFIELAASVGLEFDLKAELPDLILADLADPLRIVFCEIVTTDGAMTEPRKAALLSLIRGSKIPASSVVFLTAFEDRQAPAFRKNASRLAIGSDVWFCSEPNLIVRLLPLRQP